MSTLLNQSRTNIFTKDLKFLVQTKEEYNEGIEETSTMLMNEYEVVHLIDFMDCSDIIDYEIYMIKGIDKLGKLKLEKLHYKGWQPCCSIQIEDSKGKIVIDGVGTDH